MINKFRIDPTLAVFTKNSGITGGTQFASVDYLVTALKQTTIWSKMLALYPMVGGNAKSHSFNLVNPQDTNAAFRITWNGGWIHSATGAKPSGVTTCFADTHLIPTSALTQNSASLGYYSRTQDTTLAQPMGAANGGFVNRFEIAYNSTLFTIINTTSTAGATTGVTNTLGLMQGSRQSSSIINIVKNGVNILANSTSTSTGLPNFSVYLGAENLGGVVSLPTKWECALAYIAQGLTVAEMITLDGIVVKYQTMLNR